MHEDQALAIFARLPVSGKVKTRLAATVGESRALDIYTYLLDHTITIALSTKASVYIFFEGGLPPASTWHPGITYLPQPTGNLTVKLNHAISFLSESYKHIVIMGSDCPEITTAEIDECFYLLISNDFVLGPASDGGFYLLGSNQHHHDLLNDIQWSTSMVLDQLLRNIKREGHSYALLKTLADIDTEEDWNAYAMRKRKT